MQVVRGVRSPSVGVIRAQVEDPGRHLPTVLLGIGEDGVVNLAFLAAYLVLIVAAYGRARSIAWLTITTLAALGVVGAGINFSIDLGHPLTRVALQWVLLATLGLVALLAWVRPLGFSSSARGNEIGASAGSGIGRQLLGVVLPVALLYLLLFVLLNRWTFEPAFLHPVSFLIGNGEAEDNAKWLDFTSAWATGAPITQAVPMGGPLQLVLTFVGTAMAVVSERLLGGFNEVAIAANTVVIGEFALAALLPLALAPLLETRIGRNRVPIPVIWVGMLLLAAVGFVLIRYAHLTLQFSLLVTVLWSATFLAGIRMRRARLLTSVALMAAMTVWLPLNVAALIVGFGWIITLIARGVRGGIRSFDAVGFIVVLLVAVFTAWPQFTGLRMLVVWTPTASEGLGSAGRGVATLVRQGIGNSTLYAASGGTEQVTVVLAALAVVAAVAAAVVLRPVAGPLRTSLIRRFLPLAVLTFVSASIYVLDFWSTGSGPNYGSMKFAFMLAIVAAVSCLPVALLALDPAAGDRMSQVRWIALAGIVMLLLIDSILPRAVARLRPDQWNPPIPFNNTSGSDWWPADVNGRPEQAIATNPVACVYLPQGSKVPTAIVPSGLSDAQRVYACTRLLAGLSGADASGQPLVDWMRREWLTNTPAWSDVYDGLAGLPPDVLSKPVILLDDGSNVIGLESVASLLQRYPKMAAHQ